MVSNPDDKFDALGGRGLGQKKDDLELSQTKCWRELGIVKLP